jgi:hypothetical protein
MSTKNKLRENGRKKYKNVCLQICCIEKEEPGGSVSTVTDYGLNDRGSIPDRGRGFFF